MVLTGTYCVESSSTISGQFSRRGYRVPVHDGIGKQMTWRNVKLQTEKSVSALPPTPAYDRKQTPMKDRTHRACGAYIINNIYVFHVQLGLGRHAPQLSMLQCTG